MKFCEGWGVSGSDFLEGKIKAVVMVWREVIDIE
jgi:hypothetical protein